MGKISKNKNRGREESLTNEWHPSTRQGFLKIHILRNALISNRKAINYDVLRVIRQRR